MCMYQYAELNVRAHWGQGSAMLCCYIPGEGENKGKTVQPIHKYNCYKYC